MTDLLVPLVTLDEMVTQVGPVTPDHQDHLAQLEKV